MINCSKFVCSKKLVDTVFQLLDTIQANVTFLSTGQIRLIFGDQLDSISFTLSQKKYQLLELQLLDKYFVSRTHTAGISKENDVHVWQLGQVRLSQVRLGQVRCTCMAVRLGQVYMYEQKQKLLEFSKYVEQKVSSSFRWINLYHKSARI